MSPEGLRSVLEEHRNWLERGTGERARLLSVDLRGCDLREVNLRGADLFDANLSGANLHRADLCRVNLWQSDLSGANLSGADLTSAVLVDAILENADLSGTCLWNCIGNGKEIKTLQLDIWTITYTANRMQIGCENHSFSSWWDFSDEEISAMDCAALEWWQDWKPVLQNIVEKSPALGDK